MRSSSIGFSDFFPFRTSDRHFEFASRRCLRGDRPRSATRIDRRILLKKDLLAFGRASSLIDAASCSADLQSLSAAQRLGRPRWLLVSWFDAAVFCKSQLPLHGKGPTQRRCVSRRLRNCTRTCVPAPLQSYRCQAVRMRWTRGSSPTGGKFSINPRLIGSLQRRLGHSRQLKLGIKRDKSGADAAATGQCGPKIASSQQQIKQKH